MSHTASAMAISQSATVTMVHTSSPFELGRSSRPATFVLPPTVRSGHGTRELSGLPFVSPDSSAQYAGGVADSLRERKKHQTRDALTAAAHELFRARGFDDVTVDEIAAAANVSPRTVFRYFGSKEAILFGDHEESLQLIRDAIASRPDGEPIMIALRQAVIEITEHTAQQREMQLTRARLAASGATVAAYAQTVLIPLWEEVLAEAIGARLGVDPSVNPRPRLLAGTAMAAMSAAGALWLASNGAGDVVGLLDEAFDALNEAVVESLPRGESVANR